MDAVKGTSDLIQLAAQSNSLLEWLLLIQIIQFVLIFKIERRVLSNEIKYIEHVNKSCVDNQSEK